MKKALIILLVVLLACSALFCAWYFLWTPENFASLGDSSMASGKYSRAVWLYEQAAELSAEEPRYVLKIADACIAEGSYTKAERTLVNAIRKNPSAELYCKLSSVYVAQDKLLDAQKMLDGITNPEIAAEIAALRPAAPTVSPAGGQFSEYISLEMAPAPDQRGSVYYSLTEQYPSMSDGLYAEPVALSAGSTHVQLLAVGENGLVSSLVEADYLIVGVVEEVVFASEELEAYLREMLYIPRTSAVMTSDLWTVTELEVPYDVADYSDLRHFKNLTSLRIEDSTVSDYSFLSATTELKKLSLPGCIISEEALTYIGGLTELTDLDLSHCGLSNIAPLENLKDLTNLNLSGNSITDIKPLSGLKYIASLNLSNNALSAIDALDGASELAELDISENTISSVASLSSCIELTTLNANDNQISDVSFLSELPALEALHLNRNAVSDVSTLASCTSLKRLELAENHLTNIDILANLVNLTYLDISRNEIAALPALSQDAPLQQFYASYNQLEDISVLAGLSQLSFVDVDYNTKVEDIAVLSSCPMLVQVDAFGTKVTEVTALTDMGVIVNFDPTTVSTEDDD